MSVRQDDLTLEESESSSRMAGPPPPPPPVIVKVHLKKHLVDNSVLIAAMKEAERGQRPGGSRCYSVTPRRDRSLLVNPLPNSVKRAFTPKNRLLMPNSTSVQQLHLLTKRTSTLSISSKSSKKSSQSNAATYQGSSYPSRQEHKSSSKASKKKNLVGILRKAARAVCKAIPSRTERYPVKNLLWYNFNIFWPFFFNPSHLFCQLLWFFK